MSFKAIYTGSASATDGRDGNGATADGHVSVKLSKPKAMGGDEVGTNPEQLFALTWSACFGGAVGVVAERHGVKGQHVEVTTDVTLGKTETGLGLQAELKVKLPGVERATAEQWVKEAHELCPYSNATRNNVPTTLTVVD